MRVNSRINSMASCKIFLAFCFEDKLTWIMVFRQQFYTVFPELASKKLFITGESYAGIHPWLTMWKSSNCHYRLLHSLHCNSHCRCKCCWKSQIASFSPGITYQWWCIQQLVCHRLLVCSSIVERDSLASSGNRRLLPTSLLRSRPRSVSQALKSNRCNLHRAAAGKRLCSLKNVIAYQLW